ncbi:hypothetical protein [Hyphococcus sp.]|uniref:hypothetical protein n=1 Tax=Hyphococcus sp. TaxID=2038636 RepID=UPI003D10F096
MMSQKAAYQPGQHTAENPASSSEEAENTEDTLRVANEETAAPVPETKTTEEVRQGHTGDHVRYILMYSTVGILIVFAILLALYLF